jgi:agmatinase
MSQQPATQYSRHGQTPFFRLPSADLSLRGPESYAGARAVLLGVPCDDGTTYQPSARLAPYHVRRVSALVNSYLDHADLTSHLAAHLLLDGIALLALR